MAACSLKSLYGKEQRHCFSFPERAGHSGSQAQWRRWDLRHSPGAIALTITDQSVSVTPASMCTGSSGAGKPKAVLGSSQASGGHHALPQGVGGCGGRKGGVSAQAFLGRSQS